jgi:hypothetical protein
LSGAAGERNYGKSSGTQIPGVPELPHDILIAYSGVKIKTKIERKNVDGPIVSIL